MKKWESEKLVYASGGLHGVMLPLTAPCWLPLASGEHVVWAVVQLDYDEDMRPLHWMYGSMETEFEVQRTIRRAELTAFLCLVKE